MFFFILLLFPFHVRREKTLIIDSFHIIIILICVDNWLIDIETTLIQSFSITHDDHSIPFSLQFLLLHKTDCCFFLSRSKCSFLVKTCGKHNSYDEKKNETWISGEWWKGVFLSCCFMNIFTRHLKFYSPCRFGVTCQSDRWSACACVCVSSVLRAALLKLLVRKKEEHIHHLTTPDAESIPISPTHHDFRFYFAIIPKYQMWSKLWQCLAIEISHFGHTFCGCLKWEKNWNENSIQMIMILYCIFENQFTSG